MTQRRLLQKLGAVLILFGVLAPSLTQAVVPYRVEELFRGRGCEVVKAELAAETEIDGESIYIAWCSAIDVYLEVAFCKGMSCRVLDH